MFSSSGRSPSPVVVATTSHSLSDLIAVCNIKIFDDSGTFFVRFSRAPQILQGAVTLNVCFAWENGARAANDALPRERRQIRDEYRIGTSSKDLLMRWQYLNAHSV